ncbi:GxxExxY protein [Anaerosporobacter sp.]|uniref:GxxExxY protein n=1 Tax=Anaerosporobacter sp. TaxID=1872529 RepID=UPI00286EDB43|nr:AAA family ATPase [Anaerosporobacter sp.]
MKKKFNITGLCVKDKHYMVDISDKIEQIVTMVDEGEYFTINRPRQFGKTTTLNVLREALSEKYAVIDSSFEGVGDNLFDTEEGFCKRVFKTFADSIRFTDKETHQLLLKYNTSKNFGELSDAITEFVLESRKKIVLLIDEVDKSSNNRIFLQFLGVLRNKYLSASANKDFTFQSVILAGVHDVRTLKLAMRDESDKRFNSPWNIAAKFEVDMSFNAHEIGSMLLDYQSETGIGFDVNAIAEQIHMFTSGYPYLVSDICKTVDEKLGAVWTEESIYMAVKAILNEKNTLFEDVIKNIENNEDIKSVTNELLLSGSHISFHPFSYEAGIMYGIFRNDKGKVVIHNKIFEELIYGYMTEKSNIRKLQVRISENELNQFTKADDLDMERILLKFQDFMYEEYRSEDEKFYESQGRLIFLAYLKPILNGKGFYFVEPQTRENRRLDVVVIYNKHKYIVELKLWNGEKYHEKGREQLARYLHIQNIDIGYLLVFNFNKSKEKSSDWVTVEDKKLFEVIL